jgi:hypothetical protein
MESQPTQSSVPQAAQPAVEEEQRTPAKPLTALSRHVIDAFLRKEAEEKEERKITVNPIVTKFASWYEKLRNAMEFREDEVVLRATIERILKRRLLLGGNGKTTAESLVKELLWARYLPNEEIAVSVVHRVERRIDLYLALRLKSLQKRRMSEAIMNEWIYDLMSADIQYILNPKPEKEVIANYMFKVLQDDVEITDDSEVTKDAQVYMAIRKAYSRDDLAFLRYHLFNQYFGRLSTETIEHTSEHFTKGLDEINLQLAYPLKDRIYTYVKRRTAVFFILEDVLRTKKENLHEMLSFEEELKDAVYAACDIRYQSITSKVRRAIIRSVIFILFTKVAFAFFVEGTYERVFLGGIQWGSIIINTTIPPLLMIIVSLFIRAPGVDNSKQILAYINQLLHEENPRMGNKLSVAKETKKATASHKVFNTLWFLGFLLSFGAVVFILSHLHFNIISQFIFIFFLAIVSFLSYRISLIANTFKVGEKQGLTTLVVDFLFMPIIRVGRNLTQSIAQVNIFLMFFDFFIEAPFKYIFAFFDQWFHFLHAKTEELE